MKAATLILAWGIAAAAAARGGAQGPDGSAVPGPQPDGYTLLHNQRLIHPVGDQVPLGDFPVGMAVNPLGTAAAVLHAGYGRHEIRMVDLASKSVFASVALREGFGGVGFSPDGRTLLCSGGSEGVLHRFRFSGGHLAALPPPRFPGGSRRSGARRGGRIRVRLLRGVLDRAHLFDDLFDVPGAHDGLVGAEDGPAFVGDGLLDVGDDLIPVRVGCEPACGAVEVAAQHLITALFQLVGVAVEIDGDDLVHGCGESGRFRVRAAGRGSSRCR